MPDIIDIDADPYCQSLVDAGLLVDVKQFLIDEGKYDDYQETALRYQEFTDGSMYTLPLEYHIEMIWYRKDIFEKYSLEVPTTMEEWLEVCRTLSENGITPIAVDGVDRWPVLRYMAMIPFRYSGNDFLAFLHGASGIADEYGEAEMSSVRKYYRPDVIHSHDSAVRTRISGPGLVRYGGGFFRDVERNPVQSCLASGHSIPDEV